MHGEVDVLDPRFLDHFVGVECPLFLSPTWHLQLKHLCYVTQEAAAMTAVLWDKAGQTGTPSLHGITSFPAWRAEPRWERHVTQHSYGLLFFRAWVQLSRKRDAEGCKSCEWNICFITRYEVPEDIYNICFAWRMASSGMLRRVALLRTGVSEELSASIIRLTRIGELRITLAVTSNRRPHCASAASYR
jgi:hypothetical protein